MDFVLKKKRRRKKRNVLVWPSPLSQPTIRTALSLSGAGWSREDAAAGASGEVQERRAPSRAAAAAARWGSYFPSILPLPHSLLLLFSS
jgi:hypothetical protein